MKILFDETFELPIEEVYSYFRSPRDWVRLYGVAGEVIEYDEGWVGVPLERFPFPLVARNTKEEPNELVHWEFRGFWKGEGEVRFAVEDETVRLEGYETISIRWLGFLSPLVEVFLKKRFVGVWKLGWRRLRKGKGASN